MNKPKVELARENKLDSLEKIDLDDLKEMDIAWEVAMTGFHVKNIAKKTGKVKWEEFERLSKKLDKMIETKLKLSEKIGLGLGFKVASPRYDQNAETADNEIKSSQNTMAETGEFS
ncbi:hypothetical protein QVD17_41713 [Tagetes erecta]|uniref:Uncharacterized protein n=1 Tax=Tagetes erecta TaxID=13708 RepID=A0AAD8JMM1_TARER|nr:hypothetical protein QVD17_41713 [Tagetes erecta]